MKSILLFIVVSLLSTMAYADLYHGPQLKRKLGRPISWHWNKKHNLKYGHKMEREKKYRLAV